MMRLRTNEIYKAVTAELDALGATYTVEPGAKHFMVRYEVNGVKGQTTIASSSSDWRAPLNAKRNVRRDLRQAGVIQPKVNDAWDGQTLEELVPEAAEPAAPEIKPVVSEKKEERIVSESMTLGEENLVIIDGEPRMRDVDIGAALGYKPVLNVRALIRSNFDELKRYGAVAEEPVPTGAAGGRPSVNYLLNREQAILLSVLSQTARAADVRYQVIKAYSAWEEHHIRLQAPAVIEQKPAEPEILMNEQALEAIAERVAKILPKERAVETIREVNRGPMPDVVSRRQFEDVMSQTVHWLKGRFDRIDQTLSEPAVSPEEIDARVLQRMRELNGDLLKDVRASLDESMKVLAQSSESLGRPIPGVTPDPEIDIDPALRPAVEPSLEADMDFVSVTDVYAMAGIDGADIPARRRLGRLMGASLVDYARRHGEKTYSYKIAKNNMRRQWTRETVENWYREEGRQLIIDHVNEEA